MREFHLGLDSTDSPLGGCTTHVAALLVERILRLGGEFIDYPHLVRLNPNVPFKTRGNGAVSLNFSLHEHLHRTLFNAAEEIVTSQADLSDPKSDPGLVLVEGSVPKEMQAFADRCLHEVVALSEAEELISKYPVHARRWKSGRGLIGAVAAIGLELPADYVFELIAYRHRVNFGTPRRVNPESVRRMNDATKPQTLNNIDPSTGRLLVTPRGPDPVLLGIRGESPEILLKALDILETNEEIERWLIFRSNECTDSHLHPIPRIAQARRNSPAIIRGRIASKARIIPSGHVFIDLEDDSGTISLAAYEPTGDFRHVITQLRPGDQIIASGGVKQGPKGFNLNLESVQATLLVRSVKGNPSCPDCGKRMKSLGREGGFRCKRCRLESENREKSNYPTERNIEEGVVYQPPPRAHRHLTRPISRKPLPKPVGLPLMIPDWHSPYPSPMKILRSSS